MPIPNNVRRQRREFAAALVKAGWSVDAVAETTGLAPHSVRIYARKAGVVTRLNRRASCFTILAAWQARRPLTTATEAGVAKQLGVPRARFVKVIKAAKRAGLRL
jgi:hypothetical protein